MSADNNSSQVHSLVDGTAVNVNETDVHMINVVDKIVAKLTRNVQTQHGDYRTVDEGNVFLIVRCLWPDGEEPKTNPVVGTSNDGESGEKIEDTEQVVWIEPFDEVSSVHKEGAQLQCLLLLIISENKILNAAQECEMRTQTWK